MSHTPGPWKLHDFEVGAGNRYTVDAGDHQIVEGWLDFGPLPEEQQLANARLIAAAPDLLEALKTLADHEYRDDDDPVLVAARAQARAAIAKAEGK